MTGAELKKWREDRKMLQGDLAEKLGVHVMTISKWEREAQAIPPYLDLALQTVERDIQTAKYSPEVESKIKKSLKK